MKDRAFWMASSLWVLSIAALVGCEAETARQTAPAPPSEAAAPTTAPRAKDDAVRLTAVDLDGYRAALAEQAGKVVLVDFWATWCPPCMERFPETVQWGKKYADQGLAVMSVSFDDVEGEESALAFLRKEGASFTNLRSTWGNGEQTVEAFEIQGGAVPYYKLYDRSGKLRYEFSGNPDSLENVEDFDRIEPRIQELLAEQGG
jgi:thiol-disulfide isomerase/thioredoxin